MEHARMGIMRVVYEYFDNKIYPFIFMGLVMITFLLLPIPLAMTAAIHGSPLVFPLCLGIALVLAAWGITMIDRKLPWYIGFLYPVHFTWVIILSGHSIFRSRNGFGYTWKGRTVR
jgi:hypothetical protein